MNISKTVIDYTDHTRYDNNDQRLTVMRAALLVEPLPLFESELLVELLVILGVVDVAVLEGPRNALVGRLPPLSGCCGPKSIPCLSFRSNGTLILTIVS